MNRKKYIFTFIFLTTVLLFSRKTAAQISLGIRGGMNYSTMDFTNNPEFKYQKPLYRTAFQGGIFIQYANDPHVGLQGEFNYNQKGWSEATNTTTSTQYARQINYLEFDALTNVFIGKKSFRFIVNIGPYAAYALDAMEWKKDISTGEETSSAYIFTDSLDNRLDYGLLIGAGFEYVFSFGTIHLEARYSFGLGNMYKNKSRASELSQNRVISVTLGYAYNFRRKKDKAIPKKDPP